MQPLAQTAPSFAAAAHGGTSVAGLPAAAPAPADLSLLGLVEVLLKEPRRVHMGSRFRWSERVDTLAQRRVCEYARGFLPPSAPDTIAATGSRGTASCSSP